VILWYPPFKIPSFDSKMIDESWRKDNDENPEASQDEFDFQSADQVVRELRQ
jgi:hypothetical protein